MRKERQIGRRTSKCELCLAAAPSACCALPQPAQAATAMQPPASQAARRQPPAPTCVTMLSGSSRRPLGDVSPCTCTAATGRQRKADQRSLQERASQRCIQAPAAPSFHPPVGARAPACACRAAPALPNGTLNGTHRYGTPALWYARPPGGMHTPPACACRTVRGLPAWRCPAPARRAAR